MLQSSDQLILHKISQPKSSIVELAVWADEFRYHELGDPLLNLRECTVVEKKSVKFLNNLMCDQCHVIMELN